MPTRVTPGQLGMATPFGELLGSSTAEMNAELQDYQKLGVDWIRMDFHWDLIQRNSSTSYDWTLVDRVVNAANAHGIEVVALLEGNPSWVSGNLGTWADQQALGRFAGEAAKHFGDRVDYWEILNEPNKEGITPASYTAGLKAAYTAIKAVDSGDTVITGGTAAVPNTGNGMYGAVDYLEGMYDAGAKGYFDAVGYHPYSYPLMPSNSASWNGWQMMEDGIRDTMTANGDASKQVWMTEMGAPTGGGSTYVTQAEQAQILREAVDLSQDTDWAGPIMWYSYKDRGGSTSSGEGWFGLVGPNGEKKASYSTYQDLGNKDNGTVAAPAPAPTPTPTPTPTPAPAPVVEADDPEVFRFTTMSKYHRLENFEDGDIIDLSALDANSTGRGNQAFNFIGSKWLDHSRDLGVYQDKVNEKTYIQGDINGDNKFELNIAYDGLYNFKADDFIL